HLFPGTGLEAAIRIDPELSVGQPLPREFEQFDYLADLGYPRRMDVVNTGADLVRIPVVPESIEQLHLRTRRLDRDHIGIHRADRVDNVVDLGVAHMRVDLRLVTHAGGADAEAIDGPIEIGLPL